VWGLYKEDFFPFDLLKEIPSLYISLYRYAPLNDGDMFRKNASLDDFVVVRTS